MSWFDYVGLAEQEVDTRLLDKKTKDGLTVHCCPDPTDPMIQQAQHRAVCLHRPYAGCSICPHALFVLAFNANREARLDVVACPRWNEPGSRELGASPDKYVVTEISTCRDSPFSFCSVCPTRQEVEDVGADKKNAGWYGRWSRLRRNEEDG